MHRSVIAVVVLCLFVVGGASAAPSGEFRREKGDPISKIVRALKKAVKSLGDAVTTPRP